MALIPNIDYTSFKELEGKLNTYIVMCGNDKEKITMGDLIDFIIKQPITEREKLHLALSAAYTINLGSVSQFLLKRKL